MRVAPNPSPGGNQPREVCRGDGVDPLPLRKNDAVAPKLAYLREPEPGVAEFVIGDGNHGCIVYRLSGSQLTRIAVDSVRIRLRGG